MEAEAVSNARLLLARLARRVPVMDVLLEWARDQYPDLGVEDCCELLLEFQAAYQQLCVRHRACSSVGALPNSLMAVLTAHLDAKGAPVAAYPSDSDSEGRGQQLPRPAQGQRRARRERSPPPRPASPQRRPQRRPGAGPHSWLAIMRAAAGDSVSEEQPPGRAKALRRQ